MLDRDHYSYHFTNTPSATTNLHRKPPHHLRQRHRLTLRRIHTQPHPTLQSQPSAVPPTQTKPPQQIWPVWTLFFSPALQATTNTASGELTPIPILLG
ncbi:MAG: hypothetical protein V7L31_28890 [Nostoc sp.]|uniref:hypothetical protein n=1 Tax=Nostoc sp. TaxID=1180 RepID=UPI002FF08BDE